MLSKSYSKLNVLIVDDFNNFRRTLAKNMANIGFKQISSVSSAEEALSLCKKQHFDLILSDYNLGSGKNGQQFLEALRAKKFIKSGDIFVLISANTSRNVVMSTYDCEPSAYLTKPITGKVLEQRIKRLVVKRNALVDIYTSIDKAHHELTIQLLKKQIQDQSRYTIDCQKLLGELYLAQENYDLAEQLYRSALEVRALDWAQVGLANVKLARGEADTAAEWLDGIVDANPSCLKAYDSLSKACQVTGDKEKLQRVLERATEISPLSTLRQKHLADTALENGDIRIAVQSYKKVIKCAENSIHDNADNHINFVKSVSRCYDEDVDVASDSSKEAIRSLSLLEEKYTIDEDQKLQKNLLHSQLYALQGDQKLSSNLLTEAELLISQAHFLSVDSDIELINTLITNGKKDAAKKKITEILEKYKDDQEALEKIDPLLDEPVSARSKKAIAVINKVGIAAYKAGEYEESIEQFIKAQRKYPKNVVVKLNLLQAIIGEIKKSGSSDQYMKQCVALFKILDGKVTSLSQHFSRYKQLKNIFSLYSQSNETVSL